MIVAELQNQLKKLLQEKKKFETKSLGSRFYETADMRKPFFRPSEGSPITGDQK